MSHAKIINVQINGGYVHENIKSLSRFVAVIHNGDAIDHAWKANITFQLPDGRHASITLREFKGELIAYGNNLEGWPDFLDFATEEGREIPVERTVLDGEGNVIEHGIIGGSHES